MIRRHLKPDLLVMILLLTIMNIPLLFGSTPIARDTFSSYEGFAVLYNGVYYHGQVPLWLPYLSYGMPNYVWLAGVSVVNCLFMFFGAILRIQNVLLLFRASLFGEQLIALLGMYLLTHQIFRKWSTIFVACLAFMVTFGVYRQVQLNFRVTYLLPLILYWIVLFFQRKSAVYVWLAGITTLVSAPGSAFYPLVAELYSIVIFALVLLAHDVGVVGAIFKRSRANLIASTVLLLTLAVSLYYAYSNSSGVNVLRVGRNADLTVGIADFLSQRAPVPPLDLAVSLLYGVLSWGITSRYNFVLYVGLLPLAGVVAAFLYERKPLWLAILAAGGFLYAFSLAEFVAAITYFLPLVRLSHAVPLLGTVPFRIFLILAGGLGLDADLSIDQWKKVVIAFLGLFLGVDIAGAGSTSAGFREILQNPGNYITDFQTFIARAACFLLFAFLVAVIYRRKNHISVGRFDASTFAGIGLVLLTVLDLGLFRYNYERKIHADINIPGEEAFSLPPLQPLLYQPERLAAPLEAGMQRTTQAAFAFQPHNAYGMESYVQFDRCIPAAVEDAGKFELFASSLSSLMSTNLTLLRNEGASQGLQQIYGCNFPKLRVVSNVEVTATDKQALSVIQSGADFSNLLVLSREHSQIETNLNNAPPEAAIKVVGYSTDQIQIEVDSQQEGTWLIYSDAYDPRWRATVEGEPRTIEAAYLAFKAVPLTRGKNTVILQYGSLIRHLGNQVVTVLCAGAALVLFGGLIFVLFLEYEQ